MTHWFGKNPVRSIRRLALAASAIAALAGVSASASADSALPIGHCLNLGNQLETPREGAWSGKILTDDDLANIAHAGFNTVRVPVRWDSHAADASPYTIDPSWMKRVRHVVDTALADHLNVILDLHNYDAMNDDPVAHAAQLAAYWRQIAEAFRDEPGNLWFEIYNEPHDKFTNANLVAGLSPALATIRKSNPTRPVVIGGEYWSGINSLATLPDFNDPNVYPTFHYYDPFQFTHQGATWVSNPPPLGRVYGSDADKQEIANDRAKVEAYAKRTGKVPFMGESGAFTTVSTAQRELYYAAIYRAFGKYGVCEWAYTNTFPLYDHKAKRWIPGMLSAIGLKEPAGH